VKKASQVLVDEISKHEFVDSNFMGDNRSVRRAIGDIKDDSGIYYIPYGQKGIYHKLNKYEMSEMDKIAAKKYYRTEMRKALKALKRAKSFGKDFVDEAYRIEIMGELV